MLNTEDHHHQSKNPRERKLFLLGVSILGLTRGEGGFLKLELELSTRQSTSLELAPALGAEGSSL